MVYRRAVILFVVLLVMRLGSSARGDDYVLDPYHSGVTFKIKHLDLAWVYGRFNDFSGEFLLDADNPEKSSFAMNIKVESVDTNNKKRDDHLRSPDFFNAKQYPLVIFKSTGVKAIKDGYQVTGDFTMHGETKSISFALTGGKKTEFPKGTQRTGYSADLTVKRSDFSVGDKKFAGALGDDVHISLSFEAVKK
jgi:polyisoprenoid-binding protein YceI